MVDRRLYRLFAELLAYPGPDLARAVGECAAVLAEVAPEAAAPVDRFRLFVDETPRGRLEEVYTGTFDLQPVCCPYVGYQLFGESYKRGAFMVKLKEIYREHAFDAGNELPDHLVVMLRFLGRLEDEELGQTLVAECLIPSLAKMADAFADSANPYAELLRCLRSLLQGAERAAAPEVHFTP